MTTYDLVTSAPLVVDWIKSWFGAGEQSMGLGGIRRVMRSAKAVALTGGRVELKLSIAEINKMFLRLCPGAVRRVTKQQLEQMHTHHLLFKCLGGTNAAANIVYLQALVHTGRGVGLHWHLLRHMKESKAIAQATYKALKTKWDEAIELAANGKKAMLTELKGHLRAAYDDYFRGCSPEVRGKLGTILDLILPVGAK